MPKTSNKAASKKAKTSGRSVQFTAQVRDINGKDREIKLRAVDRSAARMALVTQGLTVLEIQRRKSWSEVEIGSSVSASQLLQFTRQMAAFIGAGIPISDALEMLARTTKNKVFAREITAIEQDIRDGSTLAAAVRNNARHFPAYYAAILEASERSGDMASAFDTLAGYIDRDLTSKRAVRSALYYPTVLVTLGILAIILLSTIVLPRFETFFTSLNADLPATTQALISASSFISTWWPAIVGGILILVLFLSVASRRELGRLILDKVLLKLPIFGPLLELIALERFTRVLGILAASGVPLPDALELCSKVVGNRVFADASTEVRKRVLNGEGLAEPMMMTKVFPEVLVQVVRVGEHTGRLSQQLDQAAKMNAQEVDYRLRNFTSLLEPAVLLLVGGGVGFVAIALVSAMYGIYNSGQLTG